MMPVSAKTILGKRISFVRLLDHSELDALGWPTDSRGLVIELDDGSGLLAAADAELNSAGALILFGLEDIGILQL